MGREDRMGRERKKFHLLRSSVIESIVKKQS
jgi:hypothetical protein